MADGGGQQPRKWWRGLLAAVEADATDQAPLSADVRARIMLVTALAGLLASVIPSAYFLARGLDGYLDVPLSLLGISVTLSVMWALLARKSVDLAAWIMLGLGCAVTAYGAVRSGGVASAHAVWLVLHPLVAVLFLGTRVAVAFAVIDEIIIVGLALMPTDADPTGHAMRAVTLGSAIAFATVLGVGYERSVRRSVIERRKLEQRVQRARTLESLGMLAGGLAHDFNNIFQVILGNAELLGDSDLDEAKQQRQVERIRKASRQGAEHVSHMLAYATGGQTTLANVSLTEIVEEQADLLRSPLRSTVRLTFELDPDVPAVRADGAQLRRVLTNLVSNAAESVGRHGGTVEVRTGRLTADTDYLSRLHLGEELRPGDYAFLEVSDDGAGIERATLERIFDPFFSTKQTGRGLGLAAVIGIVRAHGGAIGVDSRTGEGTTMRVILPAREGLTSSMEE